MRLAAFQNPAFYRAQSMRLCTCGKPRVITCAEDDSVAEIMERMTAGKFRHMPVLRDGQLIGLVSIGDVVKQRVEEVEHDAEALRGYIQTA